MGEVRPEIKLRSPPTDAISTVKFAPGSCQILVVSSWDSTVRLYDVISNQLLHQYNHNRYPVLDAALQDNSKCYSGGLDRVIVSYDFEAQSCSILGKHDDGVRCIEYSSLRNAVISGSWDSSVRIWDPRTSSCVGNLPTEDQVFTMNLKDELLVAGTGNKKVFAWDIRNLNNPLQQRDSLLKYQTRALKVFPNKQGYVLSSIEGRVAVEYLDPNPEVQKKKYAFKCHRIKESGTECIYPVNSISFHQDYSTFATGGSDGFVNIWDGFNKKRLCQFHRYPNGISSLAFSHSGSTLAIACSFLGEAEEPPVGSSEDSIFIRSVTDQEAKPK